MRNYSLSTFHYYQTPRTTEKSDSSTGTAARLLLPTLPHQFDRVRKITLISISRQGLDPIAIQGANSELRISVGKSFCFAKTVAVLYRNRRQLGERRSFSLGVLSSTKHDEATQVLHLASVHIFLRASPPQHHTVFCYIESKVSCGFRQHERWWADRRFLSTGRQVETEERGSSEEIKKRDRKREESQAIRSEYLMFPAPSPEPPAPQFLTLDLRPETLDS